MAPISDRGFWYHLTFSFVLTAFQLQSPKIAWKRHFSQREERGVVWEHTEGEKAVVNIRIRSLMRWAHCQPQISQKAFSHTPLPHSKMRNVPFKFKHDSKLNSGDFKVIINKWSWSFSTYAVSLRGRSDAGTATSLTWLHYISYMWQQKCRGEWGVLHLHHLLTHYTVCLLSLMPTLESLFVLDDSAKTCIRTISFNWFISIIREGKLCHSFAKVIMNWVEMGHKLQSLSSTLTSMSLPSAPQYTKH